MMIIDDVFVNNIHQDLDIDFRLLKSYKHISLPSFFLELHLNKFAHILKI